MIGERQDFRQRWRQGRIEQKRDSEAARLGRGEHGRRVEADPSSGEIGMLKAATIN